MDSPKKVFLSYRSVDLDRVRTLAEALRAEGIDAWWDIWEIRPDDDFVSKINRGLERCDCGVVFLSKASLAGSWQQDEISILKTYVVDEKRPLIPVLLDADAKVPAILRLYARLSADQVRDLADAILNRSTNPPALGAPRPAARRVCVSIHLRELPNSAVAVSAQLDGKPLTDEPSVTPGADFAFPYADFVRGRNVFRQIQQSRTTGKGRLAPVSWALLLLLVPKSYGQTISVTVSPPGATLSAGQTQQFTAKVTGTQITAVVWSISPNVGTVSSTGLYTAPTSIPSKQTVILTAKSSQDPTKSGTATVTLAPVSVTVSPPSATLSASQTQQFTASVTGSSNTAVTWSIRPSAGTISAGGLYMAPASIASQQTVTVTATSQADPTKSVFATVTLSPTVSVTVSPPSATLSAGQTQQFTASITGSSNTAVIWSISPSVGTISAGGLYAAPASLASQQTVTVTATSQADLTKSATATVTLSPSISVTVSPPSATLSAGQTQQFTANMPVTWSISPSVGAISASGFYTAPARIASQQTATVIATDQADPTKSGQAVILLFASTVPSIPITSFSVVPISSTPYQHALSLTLANAPTMDINGTMSLTFAADPTVTNVPTGYQDPAAVFSNNQTTLNFTIPTGCSSVPSGCPNAVWPSNGQFSQGTVAGTITIQITALSEGGVSILPATPPAQTVLVAPAAPVITPGSVSITNITPTQFVVQMQAYSSTREITSGTFQFAPAAGTQLQGTTFTVPFNGLDQSQWFGTQASLPGGSTFSLQMPFNYSGNSSALGTVTVTLTNSKGTSTSVSGAP